MNSDFRERAFLPLMIPLGVVIGFLGFAFALSRVLLTVSETMAVVVGIAVAAYILLLASIVAARPSIAPRALTVVVGAGLVAVLAAGAVSANAGMRDLHAEEAGHGEEAAEGEAAAVGEAEGAGVPGDAEVFVAVDIAYSDAPATLPAGEVTLAIVNEGAIPHNVAFEEQGGAVVVEAGGGATDVSTVTLEAGEYTYYCTIPGHRAAGMEGTLTVS